MFDTIPFVILRDFFLRIETKNEIYNFTVSSKRILNFVGNDRVCQEHIIKIFYNLTISHPLINIPELISVLNEKKYSKYLKSGFNSKRIELFIRPSDDHIIIYYPEVGHERTLTGCVEENMISYFRKFDDFEFMMNLEGFFICSLSFQEIVKNNPVFNTQRKFYENHFSIFFVFSDDFIKFYLDRINEYC